MIGPNRLGLARGLQRFSVGRHRSTAAEQQSREMDERDAIDTALAVGVELRPALRHLDEQLGGRHNQCPPNSMIR